MAILLAGDNSLIPESVKHIIQKDMFLCVFPNYLNRSGGLKSTLDQDMESTLGFSAACQSCSGNSLFLCIANQGHLKLESSS